MSLRACREVAWSGQTAPQPDREIRRLVSGVEARVGLLEGASGGPDALEAPAERRQRTFFPKVPLSERGL